MIKRERENVIDFREIKTTDQINALLGKGSEFEGKLTFTGTVRIDGKFTGEIASKDILIIGDSAKVKADIESGTIIISGEVTGNIRALKKLEILAPGRLHGNITAPVLLIEEGVIFQGNCQMEDAHAKREAAAPGPAPIPGPGTSSPGS